VFHLIEEKITKRLAEHVQSRYGVETPVVLEQPKQASFGELAIAVAFHLARQLKQAPRAIATQMVADIGAIEGVVALEVAGNGYINVRLDRGAYGYGVLHDAGAAPERVAGKIIVEHTNINPNKAAHIGHLRNAILGDTFVRMLRSSGHNVEVQNYIDNTGVQVADVVAGFHYLEKNSAADVEQLLRDPAVRFDYYCWDLYARISAHFGEHPEDLAWRRDTLHEIEGGTGDQARLAALVSDAIVGCHLRTMQRLGIRYDVLPRESEILHLKFWETAFEQLKQRGAIYFETEGKNKGCWVMPASAFKAQTNEDTEDSKVIVRSNDTVTYVGKDIAYQLWKFGLLGKDFFYRPWEQYAVYVSTDKPQPPGGPSFGRGDSVYNVIDSRQS
jgi:arginyl-tRNA synthetase